MLINLIANSVKSNFIKLILLLTLGVFINALNAKAQGVVNIKVLDITTQMPIPKVTIKLLDVNKKVIKTYASGDNGQLRLVGQDASRPYTLEFVHAAYKTDSLAVRAKLSVSSGKIITMYLEPKVISLQPVVLHSKEDNRAHRILNNAIKNKVRNYKVTLDKYDYLLYSNIDAYLSFGKGEVKNIPKIFKKVLTRAELKSILEKSVKVSTDQGFVGTKVPVLSVEMLLKNSVNTSKGIDIFQVLYTQSKGAGVQDEESLSKFLNPQDEGLLKIDITQSTVKILNKFFTSPLNPMWRFVYDVGVSKDNIITDGEKCILLYVFPKKPQMLDFRGSLLVRYSDYAVLKAELTVSDKINLNFVRNLKINQQFSSVIGNTLSPVRTELQFNLVYEELFGPQNTLLVNTTVVRSKDKTTVLPNNTTTIELNRSQWSTLRKNLSIKDKTANYETIKELSNLTIVRTLARINQILGQGYIPGAPIVISDPISFIAYNNLEALRLKIGFRTTHLFDPRLFLFASLGYGTRDKTIFGNLRARYILNKKSYTTLEVEARKDVYALNQLSDNAYFLSSSTYFVRSMYASGAYFGDLLGASPFYVQNYALRLTREIGSYLQASLIAQRDIYTQPSEAIKILNYTGGFATSEAILQLDYRHAKRVRTVDDQPYALERFSKPYLKFWYIFGIPTASHQTTAYHKLNLNVYQRNAKILALGVADYDINVGYIYGTVPIPLLRSPLTNRTPFLVKRAFSTMTRAEFVMDKYIMLNYSHKFDAPIYDYIPILAQMRKYLKLNMVGTLGLLWGSLSASNKTLLKNHATAHEIDNLKTVNVLTFSRPFVEAGLGITNIFKLLRIDFVKRFTYLDLPAAPRWNLLFSTEIDF